MFQALTSSSSSRNPMPIVNRDTSGSSDRASRNASTWHGVDGLSGADEASKNKGAVYALFNDEISHDEIDLKMAYAFSKLSEEVTDLKRLWSFCDLGRLVKPEHMNDLLLTVSKSHGNWSYQIALGDTSHSYASEAMLIGHGEDYARFKNYDVLLRLLKDGGHTFQSIGEWALKTLDITVGEMAHPYLDEDACVVKNFESMMRMIDQRAAITIDGSTYQLFSGNGVQVHSGKIPVSLSCTGLTPRVQMTISALRVALFPISLSYIPSFLEHREWRNASSIANLADLSQKFRQQEIEVCRALTDEMKLKIYNGGVVMGMSDLERLALHTKLYNTYLGQFALGEIFNVPKPSYEEEQSAFRGAASDF